MHHCRHGNLQHFARLSNHTSLCQQDESISYSVVVTWGDCNLAAVSSPTCLRSILYNYIFYKNAVFCKVALFYQTFPCPCNWATRWAHTRSIFFLHLQYAAEYIHISSFFKIKLLCNVMRNFLRRFLQKTL